MIELFCSKIIHMVAVTVGCHTNNPHDSHHCWLSYKWRRLFLLQENVFFMTSNCVLDTLFVWQQTVTASMWVICMTTNSNSCNIDYFIKDKSNIISHFVKGFPRKLNLIWSATLWNHRTIQYALSNYPTIGQALSIDWTIGHTLSNHWRAKRIFFLLFFFFSICQTL